jgi:hypothetical protein
MLPISGNRNQMPVIADTGDCLLRAGDERVACGGRDRAALAGGVECLTDEVGGHGVDGVVKGSGDCGDGDRVDACDLSVAEVGAVDDVQVPSGPADPVAGGDREVDVGRIDVAQFVHDERRVVRDHSATCRPQPGEDELVVAVVGECRHPVDAVAGRSECPA